MRSFVAALCSTRGVGPWIYQFALVRSAPAGKSRLMYLLDTNVVSDVRQHGCYQWTVVVASSSSRSTIANTNRT